MFWRISGLVTCRVVRAHGDKEIGRCEAGDELG